MFLGLLRRLIKHWSLEKKSLLFLGTALLTSVCISFYAVENISVRLITEITQQSAQHFANSLFLWRHGEAYLSKDEVKWRGTQKDMDSIPPVFDAESMPKTSYKYDFFLLDDRYSFESMDHVIDPENAKVRERLIRMRDKILSSQAENTEAINDQANTGQATDGNSTDPIKNESAIAVRRPTDRKLYEEEGPIDGYYYYYTVFPKELNKACYTCHGIHRKERLTTLAAAMPFNQSEGVAASTEPFPYIVVRVKMPYTETREWLTLVFCSNIAIAIATMAIALFFIHRVLKGLVIRPLRHLRDVSDEISRGQTNLRADIDTGDEFHELAESFNRMLRHLTNTQSELENVNSELDRKVDQLAQANLQLYEANRLKSDFLANMSHELRTPLNSIIGFSEVLQKFDSLNDKQRRFASNIQSSGRLLLDMINDILDLAKVEAGKMEVRPSHFDLKKVVNGQCEIIRGLSDQKNIDVNIESSVAELTIYQDQAKLQQILTNLLSNAIKFTPEGGSITVSYGLIDDDHCFMTVADTGVGIAEEDFEIIFEKFRQSSTTVQDGLTREYSGTGLGLSIVRELCKLLGGEIRLKSELGKGSTFQVIVPTHYQPIIMDEHVHATSVHSTSRVPQNVASDPFQPF